LYSDGAVPSSSIRIPSPVRGHSNAAQKALDAAEKKAEIARKRAASRTSTSTPAKRIYKPKQASQLTKEVIVDPRLKEMGSEQGSIVRSEYLRP
jgi:hypothetical protein